MVPHGHPPTARPVHEGGGSDSESEDEAPMKGMMQGANFFIDANGWFGEWDSTNIKGKRSIWQRASGSLVGCFVGVYSKEPTYPFQKDTFESMMIFDFPFPKV